MKNGIQGLFYLISEIEFSLMSACSSLRLVSRLLDFQKNNCNIINDIRIYIDADHFIKELIKI
jgi:hypothetical protein